MENFMNTSFVASSILRVVDEGVKGRRHNLKTGKFGDNVPNTLDPPPLSDISDIFEFQTYLKNADLPSRIKFRHFWIWEHIDILKGLLGAYLHWKGANF